MADKKDEYKDIKVGKNLVARIYRNGKVTIGAMAVSGDLTNPLRLEVEVTLTFKDARQFCESIVGMVNTFEGRY